MNTLCFPYDSGLRSLFCLVFMKMSSYYILSSIFIVKLNTVGEIAEMPQASG